MKVATHIIFAECLWFVTSAVTDIHYEVPSVIVAAVCSILPDADYPKSWIGYQLGSVSEGLNRLFGHRSFLHSILALVLVTAIFGPLLWWLVGRPAPMVAVAVGYGSHLFADMMTLGGVQLFWPSRLIAVFPGRDEYRVRSGGNSERVFVAIALVLAGLFYPVSRVGFDGLVYRMGGADVLYGEVVSVTDGDTVEIESQGRATPVRLIGVDTPETVAPDEPVGCYGREASVYTARVLYARRIEEEPEGGSRVARRGRLVRLEIPRVGNSEDAYGRTLAYVYTARDRDEAYDHLFNKDLLRLGYARITTFAHTHRREFQKLEDEAIERSEGLWSACPEVEGY